MDTLIWLGGLVVLFCMTPFVVFMSVKMGTYGFFKGRQLYYLEPDNFPNCEKKPGG